jgi:cytochrome c oxidase subunit 1/cytochrome c oxidase subunit I+III
VLSPAFLFFAGFIVTFVIGGVSGVMTAAVPSDRQLTDTYFVVAHIHYVLIGINVMAVVGGLYVWFPKMTGRLLDERLGRWNFWTMFAGFNIAFLPMHWTGLAGMPRRIYSYPEGLGWSAVNLVTTIGAFILAIGVLLLLINMAKSWRSGALAGPDPWGGPTLEWTTSSPPPSYDFATIPAISSRHPLWEKALGETDKHSVLDEGLVLDHGKEMLATTALDAEPDAIMKTPEDSLAPLISALVLTAVLAGALAQAWFFTAACSALLLAALLVWLWPERQLGQIAEAGNE